VAQLPLLQKHSPQKCDPALYGERFNLSSLFLLLNVISGHKEKEEGT
jgi:hypothetical protein